MPSNANTILAIWSFKRKQLPDGSLNKHKAHLCAHGSMQHWGVDYSETYAPVVNKIFIRALMTLAMIHHLKSTSIDFVLTFPQADLDVDIFMELPAGMDLGDYHKKDYVLKLRKNLYGLKQAGYNWFENLTKGLTSRGFKQSEVDRCVLYNKDAIIIVYVDDYIIFSRDSKSLDSIIDSMGIGSQGKEDFQFTTEPGISNYLGVKVEQLQDNSSFELKQPYLIDHILKLLEINDDFNDQTTPATKPLLHKDENSNPRKCKWNYLQAIGMLNYLQGSTLPDLPFAVHQCARFVNDPKLSHECAVRRIGKYLLSTKDRGIIYRFDKSKGIECYVDAGFAGGWNNADADNPDYVLSRTGYVIQYAGCPLLWTN